MRPFFWRFFHCHNDEIASGRIRNDMCGSEVSFLPAVGLLDEFSFRVVNVDGNFCAFHITPHPEPVLVAFEQLLAHGFFVAGAEVPTPVILAHLKAFLHVGFCRLESERLGIVDRRFAAGAQRNCRCAEYDCDFMKAHHLVTIWPSKPVVISLILFTAPGEIGLLPTSIRGRTSPSALLMLASTATSYSGMPLNFSP